MLEKGLLTWVLHSKSQTAKSVHLLTAVCACYGATKACPNPRGQPEVTDSHTLWRPRNWVRRPRPIELLPSSKWLYYSSFHIKKWAAKILPWSRHPNPQNPLRDGVHQISFNLITGFMQLLTLQIQHLPETRPVGHQVRGREIVWRLRTLGTENLGLVMGWIKLILTWKKSGSQVSLSNVTTKLQPRHCINQCIGG